MVEKCTRLPEEAGPAWEALARLTARLAKKESNLVHLLSAVITTQHLRYNPNERLCVALVQSLDDVDTV